MTVGLDDATAMLITRARITPTAAALSADVLERLSAELGELRREALEEESRHEALLERVHARHRPSARNLVHYLALRRRDIRGLQGRLAWVGLSSLGRSEPHVLVSLDRVLGMLRLARGESLDELDEGAAPVGFREGDELLRRNAAALLGPRPAGGRARISVTLPSEAATDPALCRRLVRAGMDCARINCAHDGPEAWAEMVDHVRRAASEGRRSCRILMDLPGPKLRIGEVNGGAEAVRLRSGDTLLLTTPGTRAAAASDVPAWDARATCEAPQLFEEVKVGDRVWFDDGKVGGTVDWRGLEQVRIRVTHARVRGSKLRPHKGINLPDTDLSSPVPSDEDLRHLEFVARHADAVALSFARWEDDVRRLQRELGGLGATELGVILKIETRAGFENLPRLLLAAMHSPSYGVMIARGDLAVELGFERMAEVQEEILWVAEAAHAPTIWATQVLETLAKKGVPSRPEVTDAAMSGRAEAVMLNKGPYIVEAIRSLDGILSRMRDHQRKKRSLLRPLRISENL